MNITKTGIKREGFKLQSSLSRAACLLSWFMIFFTNASILHAEQVAIDENPKIIEFEVSTVEVEGKPWQQLSWSTEGVDGVKLYKNGEEIPGRVELKDGEIGWPSSMSGMRMRLKVDTTFKLIAKSKAGIIASKTASFKVEVKNEKQTNNTSNSTVKRYPHIESFYITPPTIKAGDWIQFHWDVKDAKLVRLYDDFGEIDLRADHKRNGGLTSFFSTTIDKTTQFKLVAFDGKKKPVAKTFTVMVDKMINQQQCDVTGKLTGKWRRQVSETPNGQSSTWVVNVYVYKRGATRPFAKAKVSKSGHYRISNLDSGNNYTVRPDWAASPTQIDFLCDVNKSTSALDFNISGRPRLD